MRWLNWEVEILRWRQAELMLGMRFQMKMVLKSWRLKLRFQKGCQMMIELE